MREWRLQRRASDGYDDDSERSAARTMERASNDTIESFDGGCSGEWDFCLSPRLAPASPSSPKDKKGGDAKGEAKGFGRKERKELGWKLADVEQPAKAAEQR